MKRIISIILIFAIAISSLTVTANPFLPLLAGRVTASSVTYVVKQDWETPTTGYDNGETTWAEVGSTITVNHTPAILGSQSVRISGTNVRLTSPTFSLDEAWGEFYINADTIPAGVTVNMVSIVGAGFGIDRLSDGTVRVSGSQNGTPTSGVMSANTSYYFKWYYKKAAVAGNDAIYWAEFQTSETWFGNGNANFTRVTNGTETTTATNFRWLAEEAGTFAYRGDKVRVAGTDFGNSPP